MTKVVAALCSIICLLNLFSCSPKTSKSATGSTTLSSPAPSPASPSSPTEPVAAPLKITSLHNIDSVKPVPIEVTEFPSER